MQIKPSRKSQFLAVKEEAVDLFKKGYSKKAVFQYFRKINKITMSYASWRIIVENHEKDSPFAGINIPSKHSTRKQTSPAASPPTSSKTSRKFSHDPTPLPVDFDVNKKEGK